MRRDGVAFWGTSHVRRMGGVDGLVYTNTAPLMRSPLSVSIPPKRAYHSICVVCGLLLGEARVQGQGSRVEGVHGGWDRRGTTAAVWLLRVSASLGVSD